MYKGIAPLFIVLLANALGATLIVAIVPLIAVERFGATITQALLLETFYYAAKMVTAPILGRLSDRHGRRRILLLCQMGTATAFIIFVAALALEPGPPIQILGFSFSQGLLLLYSGKVIDGLTAGNTTVAKAFITDIAPPQRHSQFLGWQASTLGLAFIIGPTIGGTLTGQFSLTAPFILASLLTVGALVYAFFALPKSSDNLEKEQAKPASFNLSQAGNSLDRNILGLIVVGFSATLCFAALFAISTLYIRGKLFPTEVDPAIIGQYSAYVLTVLGLTLAITQLFLNGWLTKKMVGNQIIRFCMLGMILNLLILPFVSNRTVFMVALIPMTIAFGLLEPNLQAMVANSRTEQRGQSLGIYQSSISLGDLLGPITVAIIFESFAPESIWWAGAALLLIAQLIFVWMQRHFRPAPINSGVSGYYK